MAGQLAPLPSRLAVDGTEKPRILYRNPALAGSMERIRRHAPPVRDQPDPGLQRQNPDITVRADPPPITAPVFRSRAHICAEVKLGEPFTRLALPW